MNKTPTCPACGAKFSHDARTASCKKCGLPDEADPKRWIKEQQKAAGIPKRQRKSKFLKISASTGRRRNKHGRAHP